MVVGWMELSLRIESSFSLKDKRKILKHLIESLRIRFHVSAAETDSHELHNLASIGITVVSNSALHASEVLDRSLAYVMQDPRVEAEISGREVGRV